ncbi:glycosyltransferase WbuB [Cohnella candidum]|uniref:Colanic acid biosynthesis glycosyltransferase WcaI n=1 Tax=Cohnella candidum TaxID=2674991 RepID=A0A3G3K0B8_9BACL|nr:glycosyltransferase WbuB [Cohnella candidum]AYQ73832.1 colanic acid biosynthesis glycosyltransferase WcaI [Cohnella candidum]
MKTGSGKVLLYSINFAPELTGIGKYNGEMVRWLTEQGYRVRVITAPPYYPQWKVPEGYSAARYAREEWHGARIWRCPVWVPKQASGIKRLLHLFSFAVSSVPVLFLQMFWRPDILFVVEPPLMLSPMALLLSKPFRVKSWLHVQDFEVDAAFELGILPDRPWLKKAVTRFEGWLMRSFRIVSSISQPMVRRLQAKGVPEERIRHFPNWADLRAIRPLAEGEPNGLRDGMGFGPGDIVCLYSGNMGEKQGLEIVLDAAEKLREHPRIRFVLCGDGVAKANLAEQARRRGLANVRFLPLQPAERLNELLNMADIHMLIQKRKSSDLVMPSKLTGMLASGKAVIATAERETAVHAVMEQSRAGLLIPPEDPDALADGLRDLAEREAFRKEAGLAARRYAEEKLGYEAVMQAFHQSVTELGVQVAYGSNDQSHSVKSV